MARIYNEDEVKTRLPQKGRNKQNIRNKFRDLTLDPDIIEEDAEELEEFSIPQKIIRKKK